MSGIKVACLQLNGLIPFDNSTSQEPPIALCRILCVLQRNVIV